MSRLWPARWACKSPHRKSGAQRISLPPSRRSKVVRRRLYVVIDPLVSSNRVRINTLALSARLPTMHGFREITSGGGPDVLWAGLPGPVPAHRRVCRQVLRGTKAADIPVEQPTKFDLVINLTTAKALGLDDPANAARPRRPGDRMKRRDVHNAARRYRSRALWPLAARAQQRSKLPTIGVLGASTASNWSQWTAAFVQRLRELGWIEGRTVAIEYRWAEGRTERFAEIAAEFVRLKVDVILTVGGSAGDAAKAGDFDNPDRVRDRVRSRRGPAWWPRWRDREAI